MKKIAFLTSMAVMMLACTKTLTTDDHNKSADEIKTPTLSVDATSLSVDMGSERLALVFSWSNVITDKVFPTYELVITDEKDTDWENAERFVCNTVRKPFSHIDLDEMVRSRGYSINEEVTLKAIVHVSAAGYEPVSSNIVTVKIQVKIPSLYPIGSATPYGWDTRLSVPMKKNGDIFTCDLDLLANQDLKFLVFNTSWWPGIVNASSDPYVYEPWVHFTELEWDLDKKFYVDKDGRYRLTINTSDVNNITFTAELL